MVVPLLGGLVLFFVIGMLVKAPGRSLQSKFVSLGNLKWRSKAEIVAVVGPPNSISGAANGRTLCQWMATGYHIALLFDGETCEGITHQFASR
jgi:hypothetical protein